MGRLSARSTVGTTSSVSDSASAQTLLAANMSRLGASFYNDSTVDLYIKAGSSASTSSFTVKLAAGGYWELPENYVGIVTGIWASDASGACRVTEYT